MAEFLLFLFFTFSSYISDVSASPLETGVMGLSAASSMKNLDDKSFLNFKGMFTANGDVEVEKLIFDIDEDMNEKGAVVLYFVVCYDKVLEGKLMEDTANSFKTGADQYKNDYPDKIVVLKWPIQAKKRVTAEIDVSDKYVKDDMAPIAGFIYVTYSSPGEHRYRIPGSWKKMKIHLMKKECKLEQLDDE